MLFNSYGFLFGFLPIALAGYFALGRISGVLPILWLAVASLAFYAAGGLQFVPLLLLSIAFNYLAGGILIRHSRAGLRRGTIVVGIAGNLLLLGYFKYAGFISANLGALFSSGWKLDIALPIGISFYTFTQIAFLVDAYRGKVARYALPHYALFVTYFPHLIAGPILHHREMIPQFERRASSRPQLALITAGLAIFAIGLFKKTCIADGIQPLVKFAFGPEVPTFDQAWIGALAYTFQLYFDFSGYSDMAIGLSLMFGIFLPLNFCSPYKATSIIDFWRRWHMTLSRFLRDYLYIPLGGSRCGPLRRYVNLLITMLLGGLWHGAAWTFVAWGALHGLYLCINHAWNRLAPAAPAALRPPARIAGGALTFLAVVVAWVFFRADNLSAAVSILSRMADPSRIQFGLREQWSLVPIAAAALIAWFCPNTQDIVGYDAERQQLSAAEAGGAKLFMGAGALLALGVLGINKHSEFIYFRF
ncbi:MBOAT family O-acyltransferase [Bradyrhizobium betae]|uniref:Probable alginate O-acetylase AlgI n=1 Tax=Bradyrhizobium betae TaxID=244734 RepID=A0A4Q1UP23_9BRAD|nr:MBOAT family protein [Bradyrhizobium betae]RXT37952.1 membrane-bound O-acyltransferase family protein [Bradyrhizobium betae]